MNLIAKTLGCAAAALSLSVQAQPAAPSSPGPYVGASLGIGKYRGPDVGGIATDRSSTGGKLYGGYELTPNVSVEAGYADLGEAQSAAGSVDASGVYLDAVGKWPVGQSFSLLGRLGAFHGRAKSNLGGTDRDNSLKFGLGMQYDFGPQTALRAEWERYRYEALGSSVRSNLYSVGLNYRF